MTLPSFLPSKFPKVFLIGKTHNQNCEEKHVTNEVSGSPFQCSKPLKRGSPADAQFASKKCIKYKYLMCAYVEDHVTCPKRIRKWI